MEDKSVDLVLIISKLIKRNELTKGNANQEKVIPSAANQ